MATTDDVYVLVAQVLDKLEDIEREVKRIKRKLNDVATKVNQI